VTEAVALEAPDFHGLFLRVVEARRRGEPVEALALACERWVEERRGWLPPSVLALLTLGDFEGKDLPAAVSAKG
jgi:hypothetical protein